MSRVTLPSRGSPVRPTAMGLERSPAGGAHTEQAVASATELGHVLAAPQRSFLGG